MKATQGDAVSQFVHAKRGGVNVTHKFYWLNESAYSGLPRAANELGVMYMEGAPGVVDKNLTLARHWLTVGTWGREPEAFYNLGLLSVEMGNYTEAVRHFEVAATHGVNLAAYNMGVAYYMGASVPKGV